jgi:hemoglobin
VADPDPVCEGLGVRPTLFEFAGGESAFAALAAAHHARCLRDPELNHPFSHPGQHPQHVERLAAYWAVEPLPRTRAVLSAACT